MYYDPLSVAFSYGVSKALTPTGGAGVNRTLISEVESFGESNAVAKTVSWEANIADDVASYNKTADPYLDCSDIASSLNSNYSGGYIR